MTSRLLTIVIAQMLALHAGAAEWKLIWSDEFNGAKETKVDPEKWRQHTGGDGGGNKELQYYTDDAENAHMDGAGNLVITALKKATGTYKSNYGNGEYSSARMFTAGRFDFLYGRIEARIKTPEGRGLWPAFWMLGTNIGETGWPDCGEIAIFENFGHEPSVMHATIHGPDYSYRLGIDKPWKFPDGKKFTDDFHVYAVEWEPNELRWYVDGTLCVTLTPKDLPKDAHWIFDHKFFILLNLAVGGEMPGAPDEKTAFPAEMKIDYVRVYQR